MLIDFPEAAVVFNCAGEQLVAILHLGAHSAPVGVLVVVGGPQYRVGSHRQFVLMARHLANSGYPVFRYDYRGMGDSSGAPRTFECVNDDIRAAIDRFMAMLPSLKGVVVLGLCDAASAALMYCATDPRIVGLALINPWVRTEVGEARVMMRHYYIARLMQRSFWRKIVSGAIRPQIVIRDFLINSRRVLFGGDPKSQEKSVDFLVRMSEGAIAFRNPVLLMLSGRDLTAREFESFCGSSPSWERWLESNLVTRVHLKDADHTCSSASSLDQALSRILQWMTEVKSWRRLGL